MYIEDSSIYSPRSTRGQLAICRWPWPMASRAGLSGAVIGVLVPDMFDETHDGKSRERSTLAVAVSCCPNSTSDHQALSLRDNWSLITFSSMQSIISWSR